MGFKIPEFGKILIVAAIIFSVVFFNVSLAFAGGVISTIVTIAAFVPAVEVFVRCEVGDNALGITECGDGGSGGTPQGGSAEGGVVTGCWQYCAGEGGYCSFSGTKVVRYGERGTYVQDDFTGGTACTNGVFGDPLPGVSKHCDYSIDCCSAVNGGWSDWSDWGACSPSDGNDSQSRTRTCINPAPSCGGSDCSGAPSESRVCNNPPSATNLLATQPDYCYSGPGGLFSWLFTDPDTGDTQSAYQVQIDNNSNFSSPEINTGKVVSASNSYSTTAGALAYGNTYYWRVMVWDNHDLASVWASGSSFATPDHQYPSVNFSWAPKYPSVGETVQFADQSAVFGGAGKQSWLWSIPDAAYVGGTNSSSQNPQVKFTSLANETVTMTLTDSDGLACTATRIVTLRFSLPNWKEIAP
ncbi:MAG: hypothetical protein PHT44_00535 [Candidatus Portnoybacteria bacterium]|nr:hypothetical protein [Candidatus Portnoybacteria bacterium]MDD4982899.1 hypothetical protein [Candidatus Portnoybacteria bacterium]